METPRTSGVLSWDECFMRIAEVIAQRSKDPQTQGGAVIVDSKNVVLGMGYNGFPRGIDSDKLPWKRSGDSPVLSETKHAYIVHAEENAVYNSSMKCEGAKMYCTLYPCNECAKTIIQAGIKEIIYLSDKYHERDAWLASRKLFELAGVKTRQYTLNHE
jgi:dCMP deaminase